MEQERVRRRRHLEEHAPHLSLVEIEEEANRGLDEVVEEDQFKPMRIHFSTEALELRSSIGDDAPKVNFIKTEILPKMKEFWEEALSVVPIEGNLIINQAQLRSAEFCGDSEFTSVPTSHMSTGVPDSDLVLYVSGNPSTRFCGGETLAVAVACNFDQFDRPIAGAINFCLNHVELDNDGSAHPAVVDDNLDVAIHEAAHVLGMSSNSFRYFWDPETATRRTARPFSLTSVECVTNEYQNIYLPDENTLVFGVSDIGKRFASIVTKTVQTVARNQFDCQELEGGQLENQPTGANSCTGDHWDERLYYPEALSGVIAKSSNILSPLTLALFEDSGWYRANFVKSRVSPWGLGAGCDFINKPCLEESGGGVVVPEAGRGIFCTSATQKGCSPSHQYKMGCTVIDYGVFFMDRSPPEEFQYFPGDPDLGGPQQADYCPMYGNSYKSDARFLDCQDEDNQGFGYWSEEYGSDSMCYETNSGEGRCYKSACIEAPEFKLRIEVRGEWHDCEYDFQEIEAKVSDTALLPIVITCPKLSHACPDMFCPANCGGRGICNYTNVENGTVIPRCNCFNETDTSPGCTETMSLDGKYLKDSSGLVDSRDQSIFDALVAVFIDDPSSWTTGSWIWASGLFVLFLLVVLCICSSFMPSKRRGGRKLARSDDY